MLTTINNVKAYLGLSGSTHDALLTTLVSAASDAIEAYCGRAFAAADHTEYLDGDDNGVRRSDLLLQHYPILSVTSIHDDPDRDWSDGDLVNSDDYTFYADEGRVVLDSGSFHTGRRSVKVVYRAGYEAIPDDLQQACAILTAAWFNRGRQGGDGLSGEGLGQYRADYDTNAWPAAARQLLKPYRVPRT